MAIKKQVKEYSQRQRINLNKSDGFKTDDTIYLMTSKEYNQLNDTILELNKKLESKDTIIENTKQMNQNIVSDISGMYEKQLTDKNERIKQLENQLNDLKSIVTNFLIRFNGLNLLDMVLHRKHKDLIEDVQQSVWIRSDDIQILDNETGNLIPDTDTMD